MAARALFLSFLLAPGMAQAANVTVLVRDANGQPLANAVVTVESKATRLGTAPAFAYSPVVNQQDIQFQPFVLLVPKGASVAFPNRDKVRHHVYSFSKAKKFELKLYGRDETRSVSFDAPGAVALGCNIHDAMSGFVKVVDTPWAGKSGGDGRVAIRGVPAGPATIRVWHPHARAKNNEFVAELPIPASGDVSRVISLRTSG